ncbi:hypothetical protein [Sphingobacterium sp. IITKGP-BTPF85]|uniref:hypothetical protein n=1 Tax=Sphingobacterium sp. IITKGP-BTPF85 TaxID=1338009 RepID=UPI000389ED11|nr:hypothetical protein [Sphingobacterium sp. IITKGP-BTPF85]KKX46645.1 hypothetical protein L950_0230750 [Sphingobacterium sp. IITKGP-BTPF85]
MARDINCIIGKNLKIVRKKLLFSRKISAEKAEITPRSLELIETADKYLNIEDRDKYVEFLGLNLDILSDKNFNMTWQELTFILKKKHPNEENIAEIETNKVIPKQVITQRVLPAKLLEVSISVAELKEEIRIRFRYNFDRNKIQNALNNLVLEGALIKSNDVPIKYQRSTEKFPKEIDHIFDLVVKLEEIADSLTLNLVNGLSNKIKPSFRKMAKILIILKDCEKSRFDLFTSIGMINDSNNVIRTISVLEKLNLIQKTELAPKSSKQKYQLTEKGSQLLQELDML